MLRAQSESSASAFLHRLDLEPRDGTRISWRWKTEAALESGRDERKKSGDDYVARLFVIFDAEPFDRKSRAVCYVWSKGEAVGSTYKSPYHSQVMTIVVDSGEAGVGEWVTRERDFIQDYRSAFGRDPEYVSGVAVMVDTDNPETSAVSWFGDVEVRLPPEPSPEHR